MEKFYTWFDTNRRIIGTVVAAVGFASGILSIVGGHIPMGVLSIAVAFVIVSDVRKM